MIHHSQQDTISAFLYILNESILLEFNQYCVIYVFSACQYPPQPLVGLLYVIQSAKLR